MGSALGCLVPGKLLLVFTYKTSWLYFFRNTHGKKGRFDHYFMNLSLCNTDFIRNRGDSFQIQISVAEINIKTLSLALNTKPLSHPVLPPCPSPDHHPLVAPSHCCHLSRTHTTSVPQPSLRLAERSRSDTGHRLCAAELFYFLHTTDFFKHLVFQQEQ